MLAILFIFLMVGKKPYEVKLLRKSFEYGLQRSILKSNLKLAFGGLYTTHKLILRYISGMVISVNILSISSLIKDPLKD